MVSCCVAMYLRDTCINVRCMSGRWIEYNTLKRSQTQSSEGENHIYEFKILNSRGRQDLHPDYLGPKQQRFDTILGQMTLTTARSCKKCFQGSFTLLQIQAV